MKEYLYRKKVRYQSRPAFIVVDLLAALAMIFSGPFAFAVPVCVVLMKISAISHSQVEYLLPRTEADIKRQSIMDVTMISLEAMLCMLVCRIVSQLLYNRLGSMMRQFPVFVLFWGIAIVLALFRVGIGTERHRWAGADEIKVPFLFSETRMMRHITGFMTDMFLIFFLGSNFCLGWLEEKFWNYQSPLCLTFIVITIILILIDCYRMLKSWTLADYHE